MKRSIKKLLDHYEHLNSLPRFEIDGRPALTGIDGDQVGDFVILTVRDPLCAYNNDPASEIAAKLENSKQSEIPVLVDNGERMF